MGLTKTFTLRIQADAAQQTVADLTKKLLELDASLEGLPEEGANKVRAEMAKVAQQIETAAQSAERFNSALDGIKPGTLPALEAEIEELEKSLRQTVRGTAEFDVALLKLGNKKGELKKLEDQIDAIADVKQHAGAFADMANGVVSSFTIMAQAATAFGLSEQTAAEYQQKLLGLIATMDALQNVSRALNSESLGVAKSAWSAAKAWLGYGAAAATAGEASIAAGEAAEEGAAAADAALTETGVGAIVVAIGLALAALIVLWQKFSSEASGSTGKWTQFKAVLSGVWDGALAALMNYWKFQLQVLTFDFAGAAQTFREGGKKVAESYTKGYGETIAEARRAELATQVEHSERILKVMQAQGVETEKLERDILRKKVAALKAGSKEYADAAADLAAFDMAARRKHQEEVEAETLAHLNRLMGMEQAAGRSTYALQLQLEEQRLKDLQAAPQRDKAAIEAQQGVIAALRIGHEREVNDRLFAYRQAALDGRIALEQQKGEDAYKLELSQANRLLAHLQAAGTRDEAAIRTQQDKIAQLTLTHDQELDEKRRQQEAYANSLKIVELEKQGKDTFDLRLKQAELLLSLDKDTTTKEKEQKKQDYLALQQLQAEYNARVRQGLEEQREQREEVNQQGRDADAKFIEGTADYLHEVALKTLQKKQFNLGTTILTKLLGVKEEDVELVKAKLSESFSSIYNSAGSLASSLLDVATQQTQAALYAAQQQLQQVEQQLSQSQSGAEQTAQQLEGAQGARKDYLLSKLAKERQEVAALAAAKAKAAAEEKKQTEESNRLKKLSAELSAGAALATNVATAAEAVAAGVKAVSKGTELPFPANIAAIVAGLAAVASAVGSAKQLAAVTKYAAGGLVFGPSHAAGGVPFTVAGQAGHEMEGGEFVVRKSVVALPGILPLLQHINDVGRATILPHPTGHYANGGIVTSAGGSYATAADLGALAARLDQQTALLTQLVGSADSTASNTARTADHAATTAAATTTTAAYGPTQLAIGPGEAMRIEAQRQEALGQLAASGTVSNDTLRQHGWLYAPQG